METRQSICRRCWSWALSIVASALLLSSNASAQLANDQAKFLGNIISSNVPGNFAQFWNQVTPENAGKWGSVESTRNQMNWSQLDLSYNFAQQNGYKFKGHTLVWGSQFPEWISGLPQAQQRAEIEEWIRAFAARYPNTWAIDVVNEPLKTPLPWKAALGGDGVTGWDWVITSFQLARQYLPNTLLLINEYGTENDPPVRAQYLTLINLLKDRGLLDGIGVQAHYFNLDNMNASQMTSALSDYAATGLDIYVSELDITGGSASEAAQAAKYQELFPAIWNHPSVKGVTLWGYIVGQTWREGTGIVNSDGTDRQAMTWLKSFLQAPQATLTVVPATISLGAAAASAAVAVTSNVSWSVTDNATWLAASPSAGSNNGSFTLSATANPGTTSRSGIVTITGGNLARTIAVTQSGTPASSDYSISASATLGVNRNATTTTTISIARTGGFTGSVTLNATGLPSGVTASFSPSPTTANSSVLTLTASSTAVLGAATVTITATSGTSMRTAPITLTVGEVSGAGPVTVTAAVTSASGWFNEQQVRVSHTAPLTALSLTVVVQRTTGLSVSGQYNTLGGQVTQSSSSTAATLTYQFTLAPGQTLSAANNRVFAVQMGGTGTAHPAAGDTYTLTYTSGGQSFTQTGTF